MTPTDIVKEVQSNIDEFAGSMIPVQKDLYNRVSALVHELSVEADGTIKTTASNMKILSNIQNELQGVIHDEAFQDNIVNIKTSLSDVIAMQTDYFDSITDETVTEGGVIKSIQKEAFDSAVADMTDSGLLDSVASEAGEIVKQGVLEGANIGDMSDALRTHLIGDDEIDGSLVRYSRQIASDTFHNASRTYNALMVEDLGLQWYQYVGAISDNTRPLCDALVTKRWIHESELPSIANGIVNGIPVGRAGLMPGTNGSNFVNRCGGYQCQHHCIGVPAEMVPARIRKRFETPASQDDEELVNERPRY